MRLHEYEAEEIFSKYGINIPLGGLAKTSQGAKKNSSEYWYTSST